MLDRLLVGANELVAAGSLDGERRIITHLDSALPEPPRTPGTRSESSDAHRRATRQSATDPATDPATRTYVEEPNA